MPKELFDQPLIESPGQPDDDLRISFGKPGVAGGFNVFWSYLKQLLQGAIDFLLFTPQTTPPAHQEGTLFYDNANKTLTLFNEINGVSLQIGHEQWFRAKNNTGIPITNGQVVYVSGEDAGTPEVSLAQANAEATAISVIGICTFDVADGGLGVFTLSGSVRDINTSGFTAGDLLYLSGVTAGAITNVRPTSPFFAISLGVVTNSAVSGVMQTAIDIGTNTGDVIKVFNGAVLEDTDVSVASNGTTITLSYEKSGGGDLSLFFNGVFSFFDATPTATISLTPGTDAVPVLNYIFIPQSTEVLTVSTSGFPSTQHVPVATALCQSAASAQIDGVFKFHAWTDHLSDSVQQGHLAHLNSWIREQHATWMNGIDPVTTIVVNGGAIDNVYYSSVAGNVLQLHPHAFKAIDMQTGDPVWAINDFTTKYDRLIDLSALDTDSTGATLRTNNTYYSIVVIGVVAEDLTDCKIMCNAPSGFYTTSQDAIDDPQKYSDFTISTDFKGTAFLIARIVLRYQTAASGTVTEVLTEDLRGLLPSSAAGGGGAGVITDDKVRVTASDTDNDYLNPKITVTGALKTIVNPAGNEVLDFKVHTMYKPDGSAVVLQTDNNGRVGINTTAPYGLFNVKGDPSEIVLESSLVGIVADSVVAKTVVRTNDGSGGGVGEFAKLEFISPVIWDSVVDRNGELDFTIHLTNVVSSVQDYREVFRVAHDGNATLLGNHTATDFILSSDKRLKKEINYKNVPSIDGLKPVTYKINGHFRCGFIAQDALLTHKDLVGGTGQETKGKIDYHTLAESSIVAMLVKEVQELKAKQNGFR